MTGRRPQPLVVLADTGERISAAGVEHLFAVTAAHSDGRLGVETFVVPPGVVGAAPHVHREHDECFYVLDGELTVATDDGEKTLRRGDLAYAARGAVHGFRNTTDVDTTAMCIYTPAGYEQYFRDVHALMLDGTAPTPELLRDLRSRYATDTL